jgi:predicted nucleic acid-binding protein
MTFSFGPSAVVVDASAGVRVLTGDASWTERWREWARSETILLAPPHFRTEVANGLLRGTVLAQAEVPAKLRSIARSGVDVTDTGWHGIMRAIDLAIKHGLTVYDAMYLQLALDVEAPLATLDRALAAAARAEGIETID